MNESRMPNVEVSGVGTITPQANSAQVRAMERDAQMDFETIPDGLLNQPGQKIKQQRMNEWRLEGSKIISVDDEDENPKPFSLETYHGPYTVEEMGVIALAVLDYMNVEGVFQHVNPVTMAIVKKSIELRVNAGEGFML